MNTASTTAPTPSSAAAALPGPDTLVLANRTLRPGSDRQTLSRFADDRWILTHALHEDHSKATCLDHSCAPEAFRQPLKLIAGRSHTPTPPASRSRSPILTDQ